MKIVLLSFLTLMSTSVLARTSLTGAPKTIVYQETISVKNKFTLPKMDLKNVKWKCVKEHDDQENFECGVVGDLDHQSTLLIGNSDYSFKARVRYSAPMSEDKSGEDVTWEQLGGSMLLVIVLKEVETQEFIRVVVNLNGKVHIAQGGSVRVGQVLNYY